MKPIGIIGAVLVVIGGVIVAFQGVSYVRDREEVSFGPVEIVTEERGFISPLVGGAVLAVGAVLLFVGWRRD